MNEWMSLNGTSLNLRCLRHVCYSHRIVMLHYDPLDQHNSTGVFWVFVVLGHHHLLHHLITSHVRNVKSVLLRAYLRSAASFQFYRRVQPSNRPKKSVPIGYLHPVISRMYGWNGAALPCVTWSQCAEQRRRAVRLRNSEQLFLSQLHMMLWIHPRRRTLVSADLDSGRRSGFSLGEWQRCVTLFTLSDDVFPFSEDVTKAQTNRSRWGGWWYFTIITGYYK